MNRNQINKIIFLVLYWLTASVFYVFLEMAIEGYTASIYGTYKLNYEYNFVRVLLIAILVTISGGLVLAHFEVLYFSKFFRKKPLGYVLTFKTVFYTISIFIFTSIATYVSLSFILDHPLFHSSVNQRFLVFLKSPKMWALMLYWGFAVNSGLFVVHISEKLGQGVLINYLLGKYHSPKEETRIFMFLDLTSSSTYAEKLGHITYSQLIQDCFFDLTSAVTMYDVKVYQYVGDEVVLTWEKERGIQNNNCLKAFFAFSNSLNQRANYYREKYGVMPEFKAGVNFGFVTIAEVGEMKKEIAFHGDAINTAAHIRSVCGEYKKKLLISADLLSLLPAIDKDFVVESVGVRKLKGKKNVVGLFSIEER